MANKLPGTSTSTSRWALHSISQSISFCIWTSYTTYLVFGHSCVALRACFTLCVSASNFQYQRSTQSFTLTVFIARALFHGDFFFSQSAFWLQHSNSRSFFLRFPRRLFSAILHTDLSSSIKRRFMQRLITNVTVARGSHAEVFVRQIPSPSPKPFCNFGLQRKSCSNIC